MNKTRRLVSLFLVVAFLLSCMAAVGEEFAMSDVPGMTAPGVLPIATEPITLTIAIRQQSNVIDLDTNAYTLMLEELSGINLEFFILPTEETNRKVDLMIASNEKLPDIFVEGISDPDYYGRNGILLPLNDYMDKYLYYFNETLDTYGTEEDKARITTHMYATDGNIYAFPYVDFTSPLDGGENILYINQNWLDALNLDMPTTTDELYDVLVAFRDNDPNGNGIQDEIPMIGYSSFDKRGDVIGDLINAFTYYPYSSSGTYQECRLVVEDGEVTTALIKEEYRDALRFCKKLYEEGLISPLSFTQTYDQLKAIINRPATEDTVAGVIATHPTSGACGWGGGFSDEYNKVMEYEPLPCLVGPDGASYAARNETGYYMSTCISKDCAYPEIAVRLLDLMCRVDISLTARNGAQGDGWEYIEEGYYSSVGRPALYAKIKAEKGDKDYWGQSSQNEIWRTNNIYLALSGMDYRAMKIDNPYSAHANDILNEGFILRNDHQMEELFPLPVYNEEEKEVVDDLGAMIKSTADEWRTLFVTGEKDLDTDWNEYTSQLEALGLDKYIEAAQSCYTRMTSN